MEVSLLVFQCCDTFHNPYNSGRGIFSGKPKYVLRPNQVGCLITFLTIPLRLQFKFKILYVVYCQDWCFFRAAIHRFSAWKIQSYHHRLLFSFRKKNLQERKWRSEGTLRAGLTGMFFIRVQNERRLKKILSPYGYFMYKGFEMEPHTSELVERTFFTKAHILTADSKQMSLDEIVRYQKSLMRIWRLLSISMTE